MNDSAAYPDRGLFSYLYGIYAWIAFLVCVIPALAAVTIVPGLTRRRHCARFFARLALRVCGVALMTRGAAHLPESDSIVVANHASYIDGVILQAVLPVRFSFVIKGEAQHTPFLGFLLRRVGARFVDRFSPGGSARDARRLIRAASAGESLAFFPEGTFLRDPGLDRFRPGAFAAAIGGSVPIVPVVISGSRHILRGGTILPRHGHLEVDILQPITPGEAEFSDVRWLAQQARQRILEVLDEPDRLAGAD